MYTSRRRGVSTRPSSLNVTGGWSLHFTGLRQASPFGLEHASGGSQSPWGVDDLLPVMAPSNRRNSLVWEVIFDAAVAIAGEAQRLATPAFSGRGGYLMQLSPLRMQLSPLRMRRSGWPPPRLPAIMHSPYLWIIVEPACQRVHLC